MLEVLALGIGADRYVRHVDPVYTVTIRLAEDAKNSPVNINVNSILQRNPVYGGMFCRVYNSPHVTTTSAFYCVVYEPIPTSVQYS